MRMYNSLANAHQPICLKKERETHHSATTSSWATAYKLQDLGPRTWIIILMKKDKIDSDWFCQFTKNQLIQLKIFIFFKKNEKLIFK
jgi:hypothetical protein